MYKKKKTNWSGFSYLEAVISIFVLAVGIMTVLTLVMGSLNTSLLARDREIASQLAQEGLELVRNIRDNNWASNISTFSHLPASDRDNCRVDLDMSDISNECSDSNEKRLFIDSDGFLSHTGSDQTKFSRKIILSYGVSGEDVSITSVVIWGPAWPTGTIDQGSCNALTKCTFTSITLSKWGEADGSTCTESCATLGLECGTQTVCGSSVDCGSCGSGTCISGHCCADSCLSYGYTCGTHTICGVSVDCGGPCTTYSWYIGAWESCSVSCGGGTQTRTVYCKDDSNGNQVNDSFCALPKPVTSQSCNTQACPYCGDGICTEGCSACQSDCGICPTSCSGSWGNQGDGQCSGSLIYSTPGSGDYCRSVCGAQGARCVYSSNDPENCACYSGQKIAGGGWHLTADCY